jgi:hypothetical protein
MHQDRLRSAPLRRAPISIALSFTLLSIASCTLAVSDPQGAQTEDHPLIPLIGSPAPSFVLDSVNDTGEISMAGRGWHEGEEAYFENEIQSVL